VHAIANSKLTAGQPVVRTQRDSLERRCRGGGPKRGRSSRAEAADFALIQRRSVSTFVQSRTRKRDSFYVVRVRLPRSDGRTAIAFRGRSMDSRGYVEQSAIAATLRLSELGAVGK
jgi:hypothetical protein